MDLNKKKIAVEYFKANKDRIKHVAWSHWIISDLEAVGLEVTKRAVFPVTFDWLKFEPESQGKIYHYHPRDRNRYHVYGTDVVNNIEKRNLSGRFVKTCWGHLKPQSPQLYNAYKSCSFGVRLTEHDNMALSCVEMGLMGRKSIFNGNIPCAIPWERETVKEQIIGLANIDPMPNERLAEEMRDFVQDDMKWLNTNYYD